MKNRILGTKLPIVFVSLVRKVTVLRYLLRQIQWNFLPLIQILRDPSTLRQWTAHFNP